MSSTPRPIQSVSNMELYNRWAKVYDTDGNILQAVDDVLLPDLLTRLFTSLKSTSSSAITITELGAGTGRNTARLLKTSPSGISISQINALDLSPGMLDVARQRCSKYLEANATALPEIPKIDFYEFDALNPSSFPDVKNIEATADVVLSTLVLEHLPIDVFFRTVRSLLKKEAGGYLVLTNMHAEMGRIGQAGFVDEETGEKIRGDSYNYEAEEVLSEGKKLGFSLDGSMGERAVTAEDIGDGKLLGPRGRKWIGVNVWLGMVMRFEGCAF